MAGVCVQTQDAFYIHFLVFLHSHLEEWLQSDKLAAIISLADAHAQ